MGTAVKRLLLAVALFADAGLASAVSGEEAEVMGAVASDLLFCAFVSDDPDSNSAFEFIDIQPALAAKAKGADDARAEHFAKGMEASRAALSRQRQGVTDDPREVMKRTFTPKVCAAALTKAKAFLAE